MEAKKLLVRYIGAIDRAIFEKPAEVIIWDFEECFLGKIPYELPQLQYDANEDCYLIFDVIAIDGTSELDRLIAEIAFQKGWTKQKVLLALAGHEVRHRVQKWLLRRQDYGDPELDAHEIKFYIQRSWSSSTSISQVTKIVRQGPRTLDRSGVT